ncbi:hypothetical protein BDV39DRAFT_199781 [Aspergillus sergii]|uniref:Uncharacterized protein n=1 Tax=Aspergillus sergii TaxID=1034303 RepID=A0A5N6XJ55_9EURO|nr:hypothetical protein BDV39DRAFT_199781 [Aspergillus sergii]
MLVCSNAHLQSGLQIIKEMRPDGLTTASPFPVEHTLLEALLKLESQSSFHGVHVPVRHLDAQLVYHGGYDTSFLMPFQNLKDTREALQNCWSLQTEVELLRDYGVLQPKQQRLLSCQNQYDIFLNAFRRGPLYIRLAQQKQRAVDMMRDPDPCAEASSPYPVSSGTKTTDTWVRKSARRGSSSDRAISSTSAGDPRSGCVPTALCSSQSMPGL